MTLLRRSEAPDLMTQIIEETRRRNCEQLRLQNAAPHPVVNDQLYYAPRRARTPKQRVAVTAQIMFALLFSTVVTLSMLLGALAGICVVVFIFAFMIAPISAPFFMAGALIGGGFLYALVFAKRLARKTARYGRNSQIVAAPQRSRS